MSELAQFSVAVENADSSLLDDPEFMTIAISENELNIKSIGP